VPIAALLFSEQFTDSSLSGFVMALIPGVGVSVVIGLLACTAPTVRALRIAPTEALRGDG
jgi:ABC-type lipoprotein release transport system permease subunit